MVSSWFLHALVAVVAIGGMQALFKVPTARGQNKFVFSFLSLAVAALLSLVFLRSYITFDSKAALFGFLWGTGYALMVMLQMELLKKLDTNALFPITSTSSHVLVVVIGLLFFHDQISMIQFLGIVLSVLVLGMYNHTHRHINFKNGLLLGAVGIVLLSVATKSIQKLGSISVEPENFIFWELFFAMIAAGAILLFVKRKDIGKKISVSKEMLLWSLGLGALNFIGTTEIVRALSTGPFSLVYTVNSFYMLITSLIAWKLFGEILTRRKMLFLFVAILAVILVGIG